jgi:hypothetical protein
MCWRRARGRSPGSAQQVCLTYNVVSSPGEGRERPPRFYSTPLSAFGIGLPRAQIVQAGRVRRRANGSEARAPEPFLACEGVTGHLWPGTPPHGLPSLRRTPAHSRGPKFSAWDCKVTPAYGACQARNTICCILNNDGPDARGRSKFSTPRSHQAKLSGDTGSANRLWRLSSGSRCGGIAAATAREIGWRERVEVKRLDRRLAGFASWEIRQGNCASVQGLCGDAAHRHVNVFEDLARSDAENSLEGFHEVVPLTAAVLATERIGEAEIGVELFGFDQKSSAVCLPFIFSHGAISGYGVLLLTMSSAADCL